MNKRGSARQKRGKLYARARYGEKRRVELQVPWAKTDDEATERANLIGETADRLLDVGRADLVKGTARELARADTPERLALARKAIAVILKDEKSIRAGKDITVKQWGQQYTSGALSKKYPDHVKDKDFKRDAGRLRMYVYPHVGDVPVRAFGLSHGAAVMRALPAHLSAASRRHVAQALMRIMHLAVFPGGLLKSSPLPRGWLPKPGKRKHYSCLYPREEEQFLRHEATPFDLRLFFGVLGREGMRLSELWDSEWWQWNLIEGTFMATKTKTADPRVWALRPDVARAMTRLKLERPKLSRPFAALDDIVGDRTKTAEFYRSSLRAAGVARSELFETTDHTGQLRAHDSRALFVTMSIAEGRPETWIRDRTAHKSTSMIDRYRRQARQVEELKLGSLCDLETALWGPHGGQIVNDAPEERHAN